MKTMILMIVLLVSMRAPYVSAEDIPDTPGNRQAAAERYLSVAPMDSMMKDMIEKTAENLPGGQREEFVEFMTNYVRINVLKRSALSSMVRHFTVRELNALADFYGSPEGRSTTKKLGVYMADVMPVIQQEMARALQQYKAKNNKPIMDKYDRKKLNDTLEYRKSETTVKWTNEDSGASYEATPHRAYSNNGSPCRKVDIITIIASNNIETEITACRNKKGQWVLQ